MPRSTAILITLVVVCFTAVLLTVALHRRGGARGELRVGRWLNMMLEFEAEPPNDGKRPTARK